MNLEQLDFGYNEEENNNEYPDIDKLEREMMEKSSVENRRSNVHLNKRKEKLIVDDEIEKTDTVLIPNKRRTALKKYEYKASDLPSKGVLYPDNVRIFYTEYTVLELEKLSNEMQYMNVDQMFKICLEGIHVENMNKLNLTFDDFAFIIMLRKFITFPEDSVIYTIPCPVCGKESDYTYTYNEFETYDLESTNNKIEKREKFNFYFNDDTEETLELIFKPLTVKNFFKIYDDKMDEKDISFSVYQCSNKDPKDLMDNYFDTLTREMKHRLDKVEEAFIHSFKPKHEKCNNVLDKESNMICGSDVIFDVDRNYSLVLPSRFN